MNGRLAGEYLQKSVAQITYRFHRHPRDVSWNQYERARKTFIECIQGTPGVIAVYESGQPSVRGISDIDIIVVVEENIGGSETLRSAIEAAKTDEYYFFHGPEVITRGVFAAYHNVLPQPKTLHHLWGERLSYDDTRQEYIPLVYIVDSVNTTYPREFLEFLFLPSLTETHELQILSRDMLCLLCPQVLARRFPVRIDVRLAIHRLNSLRNDMNLFVEQYSASVPKLQHFDEAITELRQGWFDHEDPEAMLLTQLADASSVCFEFVGALDSFLGNEGIRVNERISQIRLPDTYANVYLPDWSKAHAEQGSVTNFANLGLPSCLLPQSVTVNERLRSEDNRVHAPNAFRRAVRQRDQAAEKRAETMAAYSYHPLRSPYLKAIGLMNEAKLRIALKSDA